MPAYAGGGFAGQGPGIGTREAKPLRECATIAAPNQDPKVAVEPTLGALKTPQLLVHDRERQFDSSLQGLRALIHRKIACLLKRCAGALRRTGEEARQSELQVDLTLAILRGAMGYLAVALKRRPPRPVIMSTRLVSQHHFISLKRCLPTQTKLEPYPNCRHTRYRSRKITECRLWISNRSSPNLQRKNIKAGKASAHHSNLILGAG